MKFKSQHKDFKPTATRSKEEKHTAHRDKKEIDYEVELNEDSAYHKWSEELRQQSEEQQDNDSENSDKTG